VVTRIELATKPDFFDAEGAALKDAAVDLGIVSIRQVYTRKVYYFSGKVSHDIQRRIAEALLADVVTQDYGIDEQIHCPGDKEVWSVEITFNRGVTDMVAETALKGIRDLGIWDITEAKTARRFEFTGDLTEGEKELVVEKLLMNKVIEHVLQPGETIFFPTADDRFTLVHVTLLDADDSDLLRISKQRDLFLSLNEMKTIQRHFRDMGREPTDVELEMVAQTWSEHCSHKTLKGAIDFNGHRINNLLKQTIFKVTEELNKPWCVSVFKDNAGIIEFDDEFNICFKVETHNHPSAMEPYGGANTGIGGVIRDPLGTGLGAKPVINTDVFCFGPVDMNMKDVPKGVLHPKRVMQGVVAGVRDYSNRMGIPTTNGAVFFDERYLGNPLVFCGNVGLIPRHKCEKTVVPGDAILVIGGRTGRDGIHGATASSGELHTESEGTWSGAVQIGNPIVEKKVVDTLMQARDKGLYRAITDCGAGGLSSAVGELAASTGAEVDLERVPLKYHGLSYMEIWISEAQERMVIFVPPEKVKDALELFACEDVEATVIGRTTDDKKIRLRYKGTIVGELDVNFLHDGLPETVRKAAWQKPVIAESPRPDKIDYTKVLHDILASPNVCSKEWIVRQYDHEVQGGSVLKPLVGVANDGPGDASITRPRLGSQKAVILSNGLNPKYGLIDPYWMAASAIDEALRNIVAVGGSLDRTALLDNFCWGNTEKPDRLGGLVRAAQACYDMAKVFETPFISGKDSLNNEFQIDSGDAIAIPPTLLVSAISVMDDARKAVSMDFKKNGSYIYVVGVTKNEMGGSHYYDLQGMTSSSVPTVDGKEAREIFTRLSTAIANGCVRACHDCSEGGIAMALAEMAFAGGLGAGVALRNIPRTNDVSRDDIALFSESNSRFVVEVHPKRADDFEEIMSQSPFAHIGEVKNNGKLLVRSLHGEILINEKIANLKESWQKTLRW
jgi:phosphoribosylformylglycinamidine synthase II